MITLLATHLPVLTILLVLIVAGVLLWLITTYIPMHPTIRKLLVAVAVIVLVIWLLKEFGVWNSLKQVHV